MTKSTQGDFKESKEYEIPHYAAFLLWVIGFRLSVI